jgi:hypothetical protein
MRQSLGPIVFLALLGGCVHTVQVAMPPAPAVTIDASAVAVVAADRSCHGIADALVAELNRLEGVSVDPRAEIRLEVTGCDLALHPVVDIEITPKVDRRRITVQGWGHAVLTVKVGGETQAHLIGASHQGLDGAWGEIDLPGLSRAMERDLVETVAVDLAEQLRPLPRLVDRRVYGRAGRGSPRSLHNLAVAAEARGELVEARRLARLSYEELPSARSAAYLDELDDLLYRVRQPEPSVSALQRP